MFLDWRTLSPVDTTSIVVGVLTLTAFLVVGFRPNTTKSKWASLPVVNDKQGFELSYAAAKKRFQANAENIVKTGFEKSSNAFHIITDSGLQTIFSPKYIDDFRNETRLSFRKFFQREIPADIPGFEPFGPVKNENMLIHDVIRTKMTQTIGRTTELLSTEATDALQKHWTDNPEWHELTLKPTILEIVAQLSSKIFLGDDICRNPTWLRITVNYTVDSMYAAAILRLWPRPVRHIIARFLPCCKTLRSQIKEAREIILPVLEQKRARKAALLEHAKPIETDRYSADCIEWLEESAKSNGAEYDPAIAQLSFSMAAIHTTSDMLTQVIYDLCENMELIQPLREEIVGVIGEDGWKKTALNKLVLMDSVLKESQRLKPISMVSLRRLALSPVDLHDGIQIPTGASVMVTNEGMWSTENYGPNATKFDGYRFLHQRQIPGHETSAQLISPSPEHMGFGYGKQACPGRFFAANEVKIALCHLLMKYDFKAVGQGTKWSAFKPGLGLTADPRGRVVVRRRREEVEL